MKLHAKILNLPDEADPRDGGQFAYGYKNGHRAARLAAAELALTADAEIERLREALAYMVANVGQPVSLETRDGFNKARALVGALSGAA